MSSDPLLNGTDYLMLGFDYELRSRGYAGNSCQIVLELGGSVSADRLRERVATLVGKFPILAARPASLFLPRWRVGEPLRRPQVRTHRDAPGLRDRLLNEPLAVRDGELMRFDLVERAEGETDVVFTWAHAFMDAPAAEFFLAVVGNEPVVMPESALPICPAPPPARQRWQLARRNLQQIHDYSEKAPRSPPIRHAAAPSELRFRVEKFSADETARVRSNAAKLCGGLGRAQFNMAVSFVELHRFYERLGHKSPSYVLPVPVGLRAKGTMAPVFGNQVGMMMLQTLPEQLGSIAAVVPSIKSQIEKNMRDGLVQSGRWLTEFVRFLPLPIFMRVIKHGLHGEICSLFYGDTAAVNPRLVAFLSAPIRDFAHIAAVTPTPGLGVVFHEFRGCMRLTIVHALPMFDEREIAEFAVAMRGRMLEP